MQGDKSSEGNFNQLLNLRSEDVPNLKQWLNNKKTYTSSTIQNEILELFSNSIVNEIVNEINNESNNFGVIMDGTQDITGVEQESICIRYIDKELNPREEFIGLYTASETTGKALAAIVKDVLLRLQLPISNLISQTYDGAANMSGYNKKRTA